MSISELIQLTTRRFSNACAGLSDELRFRYQRYQILNRISVLSRDRDYFDHQVREGLAGVSYCDKEIAKAQSDFNKLK